MEKKLELYLGFAGGLLSLVLSIIAGIMLFFFPIPAGWSRLELGDYQLRYLITFAGPVIPLALGLYLLRRYPGFFRDEEALEKYGKYLLINLVAAPIVFLHCWNSISGWGVMNSTDNSVNFQAYIAILPFLLLVTIVTPLLVAGSGILQLFLAGSRKNVIMHRQKVDAYPSILQTLTKIRPDISVTLERFTEVSKTTKKDTEEVLMKIIADNPGLGEYLEVEQVFIRKDETGEMIDTLLASYEKLEKNKQGKI